MFEFVEKNKTAVQVVLGLVSLGLVVGFGLTGYSAMQGGGDYLAKVAGQQITDRDLAEAAGGQAISDEMRPMLLEQVVRQRMMLAQAKKLNFVPSKQQLQDTIAAVPAFQENGQFSPKRYQDLLASQQMTVDQFEKRVSDDLATRQLLSSFMLSGIQANPTLDRLAKLMGEKRAVAAAIIKPEDFLAQASVSDAEVKQYYDQHQAELKAPEMAKLEYVVLSQAALAAEQTISDDDVQKYFDAHKADLTKEERKAAHILIAAPKTASADEKKAARAKAEELLKQVKANPAKFAELAKANSQDPGSAPNGGDLGWFGQDVSFVAPFKEAVFKLAKGQVSDVVETDFGYHIIKLDDVKTKTLADVKPQILEKLKQQKAQAAFAAQKGKFNDMVYQQADSLKPVADAFKLQVQTSGWVTRTGAQDPMLNNPKLAEAVFGDDVLKKKHNTDGVEVAPGTVVSARVVDYKAAQIPPLATVMPDIQNKLKLEKAIKLAAADGAKKLAALQKGDNVALTWSEPKEVARVGERAIDPKQLSTIFAAPADKLPAYAGGDVGRGFVIYKVVKAVPAPALTPDMRQKLVQQLSQMYGQVEIGNYLAGLKGGIKVEYGRALTPPKE
ncbi:peptidylprolyl isomerase [Andreprevotia chitinilytica]|uniref:peptidylprolyl isomerase n=1 Tax=Andreprevotia chitinilytica TaxID=396808 RepID=UPI000550D9D4|nr:peptidylprolyl isomerase [Andreprevotia chitinilytica]